MEWPSLSSYRYRGRHRATTRASRHAARIAITGATVALPLGISSPALADPPGGWDPIIQCESGGNPRAQNDSSSASGLFQFLDKTWQSVGGEGRAKDASVQEQFRRAEKLLKRDGLSPWNASKSCWGDAVAKAAKEKKADKKSSDKKTSDDEKAEKKHEDTAGNGGAARESVYTVRPGDTLSGIAQVHGDGASTWPRLAALNRDVVENPDLIFPGEQIKLK